MLRRWIFYIEYHLFSTIYSLFKLFFDLRTCQGLLLVVLFTTAYDLHTVQVRSLNMILRWGGDN